MAAANAGDAHGASRRRAPGPAHGAPRRRASGAAHGATRQRTAIRQLPASTVQRAPGCSASSAAAATSAASPTSQRDRNERRRAADRKSPQPRLRAGRESRRDRLEFRAADRDDARSLSSASATARSSKRAGECGGAQLLARSRRWSAVQLARPRRRLPSRATAGATGTTAIGIAPTRSAGSRPPTSAALRDWRRSRGAASLRAVRARCSSAGRCRPTSRRTAFPLGLRDIYYDTRRLLLPLGRRLRLPRRPRRQSDLGASAADRCRPRRRNAVPVPGTELLRPELLPVVLPGLWLRRRLLSLRQRLCVRDRRQLAATSRT